MNIAVLGVYFCLFLALYFEVFLLLSFFERKPYAKTVLRPSRYPHVSMLVPCFNEEKTLSHTIESLLALDYPTDKLDILIIDDGSKDSTRHIGEALATQHPQVRYVYKENGGKYTALNAGIEQSKGDIVGCLDADSFVAPDALLEVAKLLEADPTIMAITPAMQVYQPQNWIELMQSVEYTFGIFYKKMFDNLSAINVLPGPFSLYKREVFKKIGLFRHAHNTEDMEIAFRMHANHLKIANAHTAFVYTTVPNTVRALIRQRTRWSQGFLQNSRDYKFMYFNPRFGNFGTLVLPFALTAFIAGIYTAAFAAYKTSMYIGGQISGMSATHIPLHLPEASQLNWQYMDANVMMVLVAATLVMVLVAIVLGARISKTRLTVKSFFAYFFLFGMIAPIWLMRAAWGTALARESKWR